MVPVLQVTELRKRYRTEDPWAVDDVSFTIDPGRALGLLGPNGAGKTSVVKMIVGLQQPDAGRIELFGNRGAGPHPEVGFAPEEPDFPRFLRAHEVMDYFGRLIGLNGFERKHRVDESLKWAGLIGERRQVRAFSKGMKQRLALAQALLGRPKLLILDEPSSDLDPIGRRDVRDLITTLKDQGTAVLLNSHLLSEVERVCDRVSILNRGRIIATGPVEQLVPPGQTLEDVFVKLVSAAGGDRGGAIPRFIAGDRGR